MDSATITCPYCDKQNRITDLGECDEGELETRCDYCDKPFTFYLNIYVEYDLTHAEKMEDKNE